MCKRQPNMPKISLNGWVFVYRLNDYGFQSHCCPINALFTMVNLSISACVASKSGRIKNIIAVIKKQLTQSILL